MFLVWLYLLKKGNILLLIMLTYKTNSVLKFLIFHQYITSVTGFREKGNVTARGGNFRWARGKLGVQPPCPVSPVSGWVHDDPRVVANSRVGQCGRGPRGLPGPPVLLRGPLCVALEHDRVGSVGCRRPPGQLHAGTLRRRRRQLQR